MCATGTLAWGSHGQFTVAVGGAVQVINDAAVGAANTIIFTIEGATQTSAFISARAAGVSFTVTTLNALVAGDKINYMILP